MTQESLHETGPTLAERMEALNEGDILLERDYLQQVVLPQIVISCLALVILYTTALSIADKVAPKGTELIKKRKVCYQLTNLCANFVLSISGIYFQYWRLPANVTEEESSQGFKEFIFMSSFQMGFQFWAIPVGLVHVNESAAMLAHHVTVICVSAMSGFLRNGFRYWTPFFYGVIEVSSIPLSVMNFFKDNVSSVRTRWRLSRSVFCTTHVRPDVSWPATVSWQTHSRKLKGSRKCRLVFSQHF